MQIVRRYDPLGEENAEVLVFSGRELATLRTANRIMGDARRKVAARLGPTVIDGDVDLLLAEAEHALREILDSDTPGEVFLAEL